MSVAIARATRGRISQTAALSRAVRGRIDLGTAGAVVILPRLVASIESIGGFGSCNTNVDSLRIWRGEVKVWKFTIWQTLTETRQNLGVFDSIEFQIKSDIELANPPLVAKTTTDGVTVLSQSGSTLGQLEVLLLSSDTAGSGTPVGIYKYDLWGIIGTARYLLAKPADFVIEGVVNN